MAGIGSRKLNDGWEFCKLPPGSTPEQARAAAWQPVRLPHDWLIWQAGDLYESADAWYRRTLRKEEADAPTVLLGFDGVYMDCEVLLNGEKAAEHAYGYTAFQADLSGRIREGKNELAVHIRHRSPNTRWYSGSGIYRDVTLRTLGESFLVPDSLYVVTEKRGGDWLVRAETETVGTGTVYARLTGPDGETAAEAEAEARDGKAALEMTVAGGKTWEPGNPRLYTLEYRMGEQTERARIGLRTLRFDPDSGFWINGKNLKMKGVCLHHDLGALGAAFHPAAAKRQLRLMQEMGANALRTSHNPPARQLLDLCDEMGILVVDEIFDMWERPKTEFDYARFFPEHEAEDVASWIRRDRHHACVVMWSIGNEIYDMFADERGREVTRMLRDQVRSHDPAGHAAVTFGSNYMPWEGAQRCADEVKIPGYNYAEKFYAGHHAAHPDWVIYGSETASVLSSRGIYHFPAGKTILSDVDLQCSALGNSVSSWGARSLKRMIAEDLNTPFSMGQFIWSGIDYIGEPTPYHTRSCYFGQADTAGFPKDAYYLFQSLWTDQPMIHIGVSWDGNEGQMIDVPVMSSCESVELELNGESLGRQELDRLDPEKCAAMWRIPFRKGTLRAVGRDAEGRTVCETERHSFTDTAALALAAETEGLRTDGSGMAFVTVQALDAAGHPVENARDRIYAEVDGGGALLGVDNGDAADTDEYKGNTRRLFSGKMLILVGTNGKAEPARVRVRSTAGLRAETEIPVNGEPCCERPMPEITPAAERGEIPVRKIEIIPLSGCELSAEKREAEFVWKSLPENATPFRLSWQITTETGIPSPCAEIREEDGRILVTAKGDGQLLLRALYGNAEDHPERISQIGIRVQGIGQVEMDPYGYISAGLHDLEQGEIGAGNEQGVSFARDSGASMAGFSRIDFGKAGSDRLTVDLFTLDSQEYLLRVYDGVPGKDGRLIDTLRYQKKSIWNVYQPESYTLPERLTGIHTLCFEAERKFHFRGFRFEKESRAFLRQEAGNADEIYGDSFRKEGSSVLDIGNNVTLSWEEMDFGGLREAGLEIEGATPLETQAVTIRLENSEGETRTELVRFRGKSGAVQRFRIPVPGGNTRVQFVFLPGSRFDFRAFRFSE